ncbi:MAG: 50S ribosomal protein L10 [Patescibacteria group bacterium]|nr:50S ribosomal protein L10 [Patescibacteria group bacterium]
MPKTRAQKQVILDGLTEKAKKAKSVVFAKFNKLLVKENEDLRHRLKAEGGEYYVAKKTLFNLAFKNNQQEIDFKTMDGQVAAIFGYQDEVAPAKVVDTFRKEMEEPKIFFLGGILENKFISKEMVESLAKLPSRKELYAKLVGSMNAPVSGFVNVLAGNLRGLVTCLKAIGEKKA